MVNISEAAQEHFRRLLAGQEEEGTGIRVFVVNAGTSHAECGVSYCPPDAIESTDTELPYEGFSAFVDAESAPYLEEAEIDYQKEQTGGQLTLRAPNAKARKLDEDSSAEDRIKYYLETDINPELANHGGQVSLVELTKDGIAVLQFGGGCQGCGMVDVTLKEGIEKTLVEKVEEVTGVKDVTEHAAGENPYY